MEKLLEKISLEYYYKHQDNLNLTKLYKTMKETIDKLSDSEKKKFILEARDNNYAAYEVKKDRVIAKIAAQKAGAFTSLARSWQDLNEKVKTLETKKKELAELKKTVDAEETDVHQKIKDKVVSVFDESEQSMTLVVECLNSSFTLAQLTETNKEKVVNKAGDIISTDYKKVVELLLEQNQDLKGTIDSLIKQCSVIAAADVVKPGAARRLRVDVTESTNVLNEGIIDRVLNALINLSNRVKLFLKKLNSRQNIINKQLDKLFI